VAERSVEDEEEIVPVTSVFGVCTEEGLSFDLLSIVGRSLFPNRE
jgi:hypothetical protein